MDKKEEELQNDLRKQLNRKEFDSEAIDEMMTIGLEELDDQNIGETLDNIDEIIKEGEEE